MAPAPFERAARQVVGLPAARRGAEWLARMRRHRLVLLYHRVGASPPDHEEVLPTMPVASLASHLDVVAEVADIVPLRELVRAEEDIPRLRVAVTFDDDAPGHLAEVLPVLEARGVPATFFLSGRALHGRGAYWWEVLEAAVHDRGLATVSGELGRGATTLPELAAACTGTPAAGEVAARYPAPDGTVLGREDLRQLASSAVADIGFHTVEHPVLTTLDDDALDEALTTGRRALEEVLGVRIDAVAYPHGGVDGRVRERAAAAGFRIGCTTAAHPYRPGHDPLRVGRWEPGPAAGDGFLARLLVVVNRTASPRG
jgi:peptidoglycan/xylan/chitin deacetylase (PgdA/CDA1 family)